MTKEIAKWADDYMFEAEDIDVEKGIEVFLLSCNPDPLGSIAAAAKAYKGEFVTNLAEITDDERRYYLGEIQKTALEMPLEAVNFHFRLKGVTRGFTHQLVRQRTAAYSQESTRFAVKTRVPVALPPSLIGTDPKAYDKEFQEYLESRDYNNGYQAPERLHEIVREGHDYAFKYTKQQDRWRYRWDKLMEHIEQEYNYLVNDGMPAEDARGSLPTNLMTQVNYFTNLRGLKGHAGNRLCTQAQFEWREVWMKIIGAIMEYGKTQTYQVKKSDWHRNDPGLVDYDGVADPTTVLNVSSEWQFKALAEVFKPACYYAGKCTFGAEFDRKCSIRERVTANAKIGRPSTEWGSDYTAPLGAVGKPIDLGIPAINPAEWLLDPAAAR